MKRIFALVLALLMLLPAMIACDKTTDDPTPGTTDAAGTETTVPEETLDPNDRKNAKDNLPADFNMNGETVGVLTRHSYRKIDWDGAGADEVVAQAAYNRTAAVQERLGLTFELTDMDIGYDDYGTAIEENLMAGDDTWQIVLVAGNASIRFGNDHLFRDVSENKYLDFSQPWWAGDVMEKMSLDGKNIRYMMGDATMNTYYYAYVSYFNKRLYEENFGNSDELYKKALDYDWYYDDVIEMVETAANDVNGNGKLEEGDTFGFVVDNQWILAYMEDAAGFRTYSRNEEGYPVIEHDLDRGQEVFDKFYKLCWETPGAAVDMNLPKQYPAATSGVFTAGGVLIYFNSLSYTDQEHFRNMEDDYGILPMPRVDEKQEEYLAPITTSATFITIPKTCTDERIGGVIEALSSESYRSVVEVFYESALKMKYSRDSYSGQCIDIVKDVLHKNFLSEYYQVGCTYIFRTCLQKQTKDYVSRYNAAVKAANYKIIELVDAITAADAE